MLKIREKIEIHVHKEVESCPICNQSSWCFNSVSSDIAWLMHYSSIVYYHFLSSCQVVIVKVFRAYTGWLDEKHPVVNILRLYETFEFYFQIYLAVSTFESTHIFNFHAFTFMMRKAMDIQADSLSFLMFRNLHVIKITVTPFITPYLQNVRRQEFLANSRWNNIARKKINGWLLNL